jgi:growth arrest-specific protein 8
VVNPLKEANEHVIELRKKDSEHKRIKEDLGDCQLKIEDLKTRYKEMEWEYEVKLQQYQYLEKEKMELFDQFHKLVYELH